MLTKANIYNRRVLGITEPRLLPKSNAIRLIPVAYDRTVIIKCDSPRSWFSALTAYVMKMTLDNDLRSEVPRAKVHVKHHIAVVTVL